MIYNLIWLAPLTDTSASDIVAVLGAVSALLVALGSFAATLVAQYKVLAELRRNTRVSEVAAVTSVATHELVHEGVSHDSSSVGSSFAPSESVSSNGGNGSG